MLQRCLKGTRQGMFQQEPSSKPCKAQQLQPLILIQQQGAHSEERYIAHLQCAAKPSSAYPGIQDCCRLAFQTEIEHTA